MDFRVVFLVNFPTKNRVLRYELMRWKLLGLVSIIAALAGVAIWSAATIAAFGSASTMARHDWILFASFVIPLGLTVFGSLFVYRHTAHRRKTQALIAAMLTLIFTMFRVNF